MPRAAALLVPLVLAACVGTLGDAPTGGSGDGGAGGGASSAFDVAPSSRVPRLSHSEWEATVQDLLRLDAPTGLSASFEPDPLGGKQFDNEQSALRVTPILWADYQIAAEQLAEFVTSTPGSLAKLLPEGVPTDATGARPFVEAMALRAYRRPPTPSEVDALESLFASASAQHPDLDPFVAGVRASLEALLQSPHFVYKLERSTKPDVTGRVPLDGFEVATRLSYAAWRTMPDDELFRAAAEGELATDEGLAVQVDRLLASPRAANTLRSLHDQLLDGDAYLAIDKSPSLYPTFHPELGEDMRAELALFVEHTLFTQTGTLADLFTSTTTFVTPALAPFYGLDPASLPAPEATCEECTSQGLSRVELDPAQRSGLLTRLGFLAYKGTQTQPDTILRGVFVNRKLLCQSLGDPPDEAVGAMLGEGTTNREKVELLTGPGTCGASCHGIFINPIGFAFEHYGAMGEYRTTDAGQPIDSSATFLFEDGERSYADAVELSGLLASSPQVHRCYAGHLLSFGLGRAGELEDELVLDDLAAESLGGASVRAVWRSLLVSDALRFRSVEGPST